MTRKTAAKSTALLALGLALLVLLTLFRLAFLQHFHSPGEGFTAEVRHALYLGLKFDARWVAILLVPGWLLLKNGTGEPAPGWRDSLATPWLALTLAVYSAMVVIAMVDDIKARPWLLAFLTLSGCYRGLFKAHGFQTSRTALQTWLGFSLLAFAATVLVYFFDFGTFAYIHTRLNGTMLMFLQNASLSLQMIWQSYPVLWLTLLLLVLLALALGGLAALFRGGLAAAPEQRSRRVLARVLVSVFLIACMWGKWSRYPLRWGEAFEARNGFHAQLALNPVLFFLENMEEMDEGFDLATVKASHAVLAEHFGIAPAFDAQGNPTLKRHIQARPLVSGRPNLVFIQLESLAAFKTSPGGNALDPTPFLGSLARDGVYFENFNVVMENTSRSMFATLFGTPDVSSVQNATRNPLMVNQHTPLSALTDYEKDYFLGGSANWAQIRAALKNNLKDLHLHEEGEFKSPVVDVWGISDVDLLQEAHAVLATRKAPFLAYVQTSGNHPPFTLPKHHTDFHPTTVDTAQLKANGFEGLEEFNAVRLMDHALERYFEQARKSAYFANTIFVLWADHGIPRGSTDPRFGDLTLAIHHIPFILYAPALLPARRVSTVGSQTDILPTVLSLMGQSFWTQTLGHDLLDPRFAADSAAFTFTTFRRPPRTGLLQGDRYLNVETDGRARLFDVQARTPVDLSAQEQARAQRMTALTRAYLVWSHYLLSHNPPLQEQP
jgi:Sulfatase